MNVRSSPNRAHSIHKKHIGNVMLDIEDTAIESFDVRDGHIYYTTEDAIMAKLRYHMAALNG